eukprot:Hpha_TRINITY_DN26670_c0_g1::TRINITY_DN26670_c0_g1_i1::g.86012::m.86012
MTKANVTPFFLMEITGGQITCLMLWGASLLLWIYAEFLARTKADAKPEDDEDAVKVEVAGESPSKPQVPLLSKDNPVVRLLKLDTEEVLKCRLTLRAMSEFGLHLAYFFLCDRTTFFFEPSKKSYSRDLFWFIYLLLIVHTVVTSFGKNASDAYLNREQTEEWKGWMQVLFLMYHYFNAGEQYNAIRLYIAAYVWMTGFGNFSFYYVRKDFSPGRFFQMIWRLNFLVFWVCLALGNSYMLYYICGMHTLWTFFVYFSLMFFKEHNNNNLVIVAKFTLCTILVLVLFYDRSIWDMLWTPIKPLISYVNPRAKPGTPGADPMHEWFFRAGLDRYVWIFGMICANLHPRTAGYLEAMDKLAEPLRSLARAFVLGVLGVVGYFWYVNVFTLPKMEYNKLHPYTSCIPIFIYAILRNLTPSLRGYSLHFFAFLGKITLETYIGQFHVWMTTSVPDGQPKTLLTLIPDYPLLNFAVTSGIYLWISLRLFSLTNEIKVAFLPSKDDSRLYRNILLIGMTVVGVFSLGSATRFALTTVKYGGNGTKY